MKPVIIIIVFILATILMCFADSCFGQENKPHIDTVGNYVVFTDKHGKQYDVNRSEYYQRSFIVKDGKRIFLFRKKEKPIQPPVKYLVTN